MSEQTGFVLLGDVAKRPDGFWECRVYLGVNQQPGATVTETSYTRERAVCHALTELAVRIDRGEIKLAALETLETRCACGHTKGDHNGARSSTHPCFGDLGGPCSCTEFVPVRGS